MVNPTVTSNDPAQPSAMPASPINVATINKSASQVLQARHRAWVLGLPLRCEPPAQSSPLIIAIGGGKGGVGKSMISANLAAKFARLGFNVAALDMDCGGSNLHTYFGLSSASHRFGDFLTKGTGSLEDLLVPTQIEGLSIAASQRDDAWSVSDSLQGEGLTRLWTGIQTLQTPGNRRPDIIILDLGAGASRHTIDLFCCAHVGIVAALPEPTSVENSYLFLRTTLMRLIENAGVRMGASAHAAQVIQYLKEEGRGQTGKSYTEKLRTLYQSQPSFIGPLASVLGGRTIGIVVNQTRSQAEADIGLAMEIAGARYFGFVTKLMGNLNYDEAAWKALRNKRLLLLDFPQSLISRRIGEMATTLLKSVGI
jgi:flagellar biosynthesis protein FlhG